MSQNAPIKKQPLLLPDEVAHRIGKPVSFVHRLTSERRIPFVKLGPRSIGFEVEDVEAWIAAHRVEAINPPEEAEWLP